jgi:cytochrome P450
MSSITGERHPAGGAPRCPFADGQPYDPMSVAAAENAEPWLRAARAEAPVLHHESLDLYVLTRHADIMAVLRDPATYSSRHTTGSSRWAPPC